MRNFSISRAGFTLVELLVVIAIIGVLVALLLPAVQSAREAARRSQCKNQIKQLSLGTLLHEDAHGHFPTGGWAYWWTADPNRGVGPDQPGSWVFNILPYIEQQALHDLGSASGANYVSSAEFRTASTTLHQTPLGILHCPTRRPPQLYRSAWTTVREQSWLVNIAQTQGVAKSDYAANSGDSIEYSGDVLTGTVLSPASYTEAATWTRWVPTNKCVPTTGMRGETPLYRYCQSGIMYFRSQLKRARITDGATNTYLIGEKYLDPDRYEYDPANSSNTLTFGDNQSVWTGYEWDNHRVAWNATSPVAEQELYQPRQDTPGRDIRYPFGSAHSGGLNMSFCDGSVQFVGYDIDPETHRRFASRMDGEVADASNL